MQVFIPFSDDLMDHPDFAEMLVPYQAGHRLLNQLPGTIDGVSDCAQSRDKTMISPATSPSSAALPALSSKTYRDGPSLG